MVFGPSPGWCLEALAVGVDLPFSTTQLIKVVRGRQRYCVTLSIHASHNYSRLRGPRTVGCLVVKEPTRPGTSVELPVRTRARFLYIPE